MPYHGLRSLPKKRKKDLPYKFGRRSSYEIPSFRAPFWSAPFLAPSPRELSSEAHPILGSLVEGAVERITHLGSLIEGAVERSETEGVLLSSCHTPSAPYGAPPSEREARVNVLLGSLVEGAVERSEPEGVLSFSPAHSSTLLPPLTGHLPPRGRHGVRVCSTEGGGARRAATRSAAPDHPRQSRSLRENANGKRKLSILCCCFSG